MYALFPVLITWNEMKFKPLVKTTYLLFRSHKRLVLSTRQQGRAETGTRSGNMCLTQSSNDVSERTTFERVLLQKQ